MAHHRQIPPRDWGQVRRAGCLQHYKLVRVSRDRQEEAPALGYKVLRQELADLGSLVQARRWVSRDGEALLDFHLRVFHPAEDHHVSYNNPTIQVRMTY